VLLVTIPLTPFPSSIFVIHHVEGEL
jgi:hypothetical protein